MSDNVTFQAATLATAPNSTVVETLDQGSSIERQRVQCNLNTNPSANFTRPANTTAYVSGQLVANNTTAASVTPMSLTCGNSSAATTTKATFHIARALLKKSTTSTTNAAFRVHLWGSDPSASTGVVNGDGATMQIKSGATYLGYIDIPAMLAIFSDGAYGIGQPANGPMNVTLASGATVYALIEARGAYTPGNAEVFTLYLDNLQD